MNTSNVLLVSVTTFKNKSTTNLNVEDKEIAASLFYVQESCIQPIYGSKMWATALAYKKTIIDNPTGYTANVDFDNLFNVSEDAIIWSAIYDLTTETAFKVTNLGITKKGTDRDTPADLSEIKYITSQRQAKKNFFLERLRNFLILNSTTYFPYQSSTVTEDIYPDTSTKYTSAFAITHTFPSFSDFPGNCNNWGGSGGADLSNYYNKQQVYNTGQTYTKTEVDAIALSGVSLAAYWTSAQTVAYVDLHSGGTCDLSGYYTTAQTYSQAQVNVLITGATSGVTCDLTNYYTKPQVNVLITGATSGITCDLSNYYTKTEVYNTGETYTKAEVNALTGVTTNAYTKLESDANFLSSNTFIPSDFYSTSAANANFLSANTSYYSQNAANANFLSANTSYYTQGQSNANFLSSNTSFYSQAQVNANFVSATTLTNYYTKAQVNTLITGATSGITTDLSNYYTKTQVYNTGQTYTQAQINTLITGATSGVTVDLSNYYTKTQVYNTGQTYTQAEIISYVNTLFSGFTSSSIFFTWDIL